MDFAFMGGSMGRVVGEKFARACESAAERGVPLVSVTASGGARMQEGILSLMQMPKTVAAVEELHDAGCALITVMAHPTTGGVLASFASLGDVLVAEPGALISFAGPRVVQQTTREKLPDDFGLAESNLRFGHVDAHRPAARAARLRRDACSRSCGRMAGEAERPAAGAARAARAACRSSAAHASPASSSGSSASSTGSRQSPSRPRRRSGRPSSSPATRTGRTRSTTCERILEDFVELHGDRIRADDPAIVAGLGRFDGPDDRARSATRRAATSRSARTATSGWPIPRATARRCG